MHRLLAQKKWIPLIGLYSGMRLSEICSLRSADVREVGGIWFFDINSDSQPLKTAAAKRLVPIHPVLIDSGILDYAKLQETLLFPEENAVHFSKWFTHVFGANSDGLPFHSFRALVANTLKEANVPESVRDSILGFENVNGSSSLHDMIDAVKTLDYQVWFDIQIPVRKPRRI